MGSLAADFAIKYLQLSNGYKVAYVDEGAGDATILFIHGLGNYAMVWKRQLEHLKKYYRCISIDLPGNGYSDRADFPFSMHFFAGCVYDLVQKLNLKNVCLAGHSMGGQVAITLLLNQPDAAEKLILCAPAGFETFSAFEKGLYTSTIQLADMFSSEENSLKQSIRSSFYKFPAYADEMINELVEIMKRYPMRNHRQMIDACINAMLNEPVFNRLHEVKQPTLVLFGERDALIPNRLIHPVSTRHIAEKGAEQMPNATLQMLSQCGHFLQMEKADYVNSYIRDFLD
ncbi:MAG: alpha/beta hydrolase [Sphingobacteriales bacterium]|nr:MAG: alpha/beta hydrolase [Sphingobacteriales bacterium]